MTGGVAGGATAPATAGDGDSNEANTPPINAVRSTARASVWRTTVHLPRQSRRRPARHARAPDKHRYTPPFIVQAASGTYESKPACRVVTRRRSRDSVRSGQSSRFVNQNIHPIPRRCARRRASRATRPAAESCAPPPTDRRVATQSRASRAARCPRPADTRRLRPAPA